MAFQLQRGYMPNQPSETLDKDLPAIARVKRVDLFLAFNRERQHSPSRVTFKPPLVELPIHYLCFLCIKFAAFNK